MCEEESCNCSCPDNRRWYERLRDYLYPTANIAGKELEPWANDAVYTEGVVELSFKDYLRLLLSNKIIVKMRAETQHLPRS